MSKVLSEQLKTVARDSLGYLLEHLPAPEYGSRAAVLALFRGSHFEDAEVLLILRSKHLAVHAGEVAFPGGGMEMIDMGNPVRTALRECFEEVGINSDWVETFGILPLLTTLSGKAAVDPVLGYCSAAASETLCLDGHEVSAAEWVSVKSLRASRKTEVRLWSAQEIEFPVFYWGEEKMWGLTAMIFDLILRRYDRLFS